MVTDDNSKAPVCFRKRLRNEQMWAKTKRKRRKNSGKDHIDISGKVIAAKMFDPTGGKCCCRKCVTVLSEAGRKTIFEKFWQLGFHASESRYTAGLVEQHKVRTHTVKHTGSDAEYSSNSVDASAHCSRKHLRKSFSRNYSRRFKLSTGDIRVLE